MNFSQQEINYYRIEKAIKYLEEHFLEQPNLDNLADKLGLSPFHFQRMFTEFSGISPKRFLQYLTSGYLKDKLSETQNLIHAAEEAGLSSQSRVYDLFVTLEGVTPQEYKSKGNGLEIYYGFHATPFGRSLIGVTSRGVCWLSFINDNNDAVELANLQSHSEKSILKEDEQATALYIDKIFSNAKGTDIKLNVLVKGTNFQLKVWNALLNLHSGELVTYQHIANQIGNPKALQAVGSAVGANSLAYLIPCHRVIRKEGRLGEYRWGSSRKKVLIAYEQTAIDHTEKVV